MNERTHVGGRIELRATFRAQSTEVDVAISASDADLVGDLYEQMSARLNQPSSGVLMCERRGIVLASTSTLADAGIRWGDRLAMVPDGDRSAAADAQARFTVDVLEGPSAGAVWTLGDGSHQLGRAGGADLLVDDPSLSRRHATIEVSANSVTVTDVKSSNGVKVNGVRIAPDWTHPLEPGDVVQAGRTVFRVNAVGLRVPAKVREQGGRLDFNRQPRVRRQATLFSRKLEAAPTRVGAGQLQVVMLLTPLVAGLVMFAVTKSPLMLGMCAISPVTVIGNWVTQRHGSRKAFGVGSNAFRRDLNETMAALDTALAREVEERAAEAPDLNTLAARVCALDPAIWERRAEDPDFLRLRIGTADLPARSTVELGDGGAPELREAAVAELKRRELAHAVPLQIDLLGCGVVGLAGTRAVSGRAAAALLLQAACLHSPGELVIAAALDEELAKDWAWLKWLPHTDAERIGLQRLIAVGRHEAGDLLEDVRDLVVDRRLRSHSGSNAGPASSVLLLLDENVCRNRSLVTSALENIAPQRVTAIWLGHDIRDLPGQAAALLEVGDQRPVARFTDVETGATVDEVTLEHATPEFADRIARGLAPLRDIGQRARTRDIPNQISLLELLELAPVSTDRVVSRWKDWSGRLDSTIGAGIDGPFTIDLRADGPHALIAGTTGSGKSELLRTFVAAAAASAPPNRLTFLLVDYKGGSAFAPCAGLPHVLDVVSDLDEHLAERALVSLEAELKRRERLLAEHGAKDLLELQRRDAAAAPPLLVIAVDEFAELRKQVPGFVDGVVDIAQRGRSLGVHMVLAAQTLRNAFTPAIRANTNLRIALRVAEESESEDVISSADAARIPSGERHRGRAFARTGHGELQEFQTAYVSGRSVDSAERGIDITDLGLGGPERNPTPAGGKEDPDSDATSDLNALAAAARDAKRLLGLADQAAPWLPPLSDLLDLDTIQPGPMAPGVATIGLIDRPRAQRQDPLAVDLPTVGHIAIYGTGGSGKTTVLTSTALSLAKSQTPTDLRIYGIDGGPGGRLAPLDALPHCGGIIAVQDHERVTRLLRDLTSRIESATASQPIGRRTVLLIDDVDAFIAEYDTRGSRTVGDGLERLLAGGRAAGVHVILTAARRASLSSSLATHIGQRFVLRMTSAEDMLTLGLDAKRIRGARLPQGRGFTEDSEEFQIAVTVRSGEPAPIESVVSGLELSGTESATIVPTLPASVELSSLITSSVKGAIPIGVRDSDLQPAAIDLTDGHFVVIGPYRSGRSTALNTIAAGLGASHPDRDLFLLAPRRSPLREMGLWKAAATSADECSAAVDGLLQRLSGSVDSVRPAVVFIDDAGELAEPTLSARLERLAKLGRDHNLRIVAACETSAARGFSATWLRELRRDGNGLLLQPDLTKDDGDLLATRLPRYVSAKLVPGRGFLVARGVYELIQGAS